MGTVRGVILAGGTGSRLGALAQVTNKHLLPVGAAPMICYPVQRLVHAGVREIAVVSGTEHAGAIFQFLGSGEAFGCEFIYRVQDTAGGIAQAVGLCRDFVRDDPFCVVLGDNIFSASLRPIVHKFSEESDSALRGMILLHRVPDPHRFGVAVLSKDGRIERLIEKPAAPAPTDLAVVGVYLYHGEELFDVIAGLRPSARGELEITDVNNEILRRGRLGVHVLDGWWTDAGTPESYRRANELAWKEGST